MRLESAPSAATCAAGPWTASSLSRSRSASMAPTATSSRACLSAPLEALPTAQHASRCTSGSPSARQRTSAAKRPAFSTAWTCRGAPAPHMVPTIQQASFRVTFSGPHSRGPTAPSAPALSTACTHMLSPVATLPMMRSARACTPSCGEEASSTTRARQPASRKASRHRPSAATWDRARSAPACTHVSAQVVSAARRGSSWRARWMEWKGKPQHRLASAPVACAR